MHTHNIHTNSHIHAYTHANTDTYSNISSCAHTHTHTYTLMYVHIVIYTCIQACMRTYTVVHIYTYLHSYNTHTLQPEHLKFSLMSLKNHFPFSVFLLLPANTSDSYCWDGLWEDELTLNSGPSWWRRHGGKSMRRMVIASAIRERRDERRTQCPFSFTSPGPSPWDSAIHAVFTH